MQIRSQWLSTAVPSTYIKEKTFGLCTNRLSVKQADDAFHVLRRRELLVPCKVYQQRLRYLRVGEFLIQRSIQRQRWANSTNQLEALKRQSHFLDFLLFVLLHFFFLDVRDPFLFSGA